MVAHNLVAGNRGPSRCHWAARPKRRSRNDMLKVGFVGLGTISHEHVLGYLDNPDAEIVAVCCPDEDAARLWLQKWKLSRAVHYTSLEGMLASERLDLVEILT